MNRALRVIACIALTGCYSYRLAPLTSIQAKDQIRVTARDGGRVQLYDVRVANDTLRGLSIKQRPIWRHGRDSVAVAVADLTKVEVRRLDAARSVAASVLIPALAVGIVVAACLAWGCEMGPMYEQMPAGHY
jgi:hypothetical protein